MEATKQDFWKCWKVKYKLRSLRLRVTPPAILYIACRDKQRYCHSIFLRYRGRRKTSEEFAEYICTKEKERIDQIVSKLIYTKEDQPEEKGMFDRVVSKLLGGLIDFRSNDVRLVGVFKLCAELNPLFVA